MIALDLPIIWTIYTGRNLLGKGTMNLAGTKRAGNRPAYSPEMGEGRTFGFTVCVSAPLHELPTLHFAGLCIALVRKVEVY